MFKWWHKIVKEETEPKTLLRREREENRSKNRQKQSNEENKKGRL